MGIAIVVPATRILEIFDADYRFKLIERMATEAAAEKYTRVTSAGEVGPPKPLEGRISLMVREPTLRENIEAAVQHLIEAEKKSKTEGQG